jgi:hypothetical protein
MGRTDTQVIAHIPLSQLRHPDGTTDASSPDGKRILYSHAPPVQHAA